MILSLVTGQGSEPPTPLEIWQIFLNTTIAKDPPMGMKYSKKGQALNKNRSLASSNRTGGQKPLKERNRRDAKRQDTHGTATKKPGGRMY